MKTNYDKFAVKVLRKVGELANQPAVDYIAYCKFTDEELKQEVPKGEEHSANADGSVKTLGEYIKLGSANIRRLAPIHGEVFRNDIYSAESLEIWDTYLGELGKGVDTWLTQEEFFSETASEEEI